jgi:hypothetical protein
VWFIVDDDFVVVTGYDKYQVAEVIHFINNFVAYWNLNPENEAGPVEFYRQTPSAVKDIELVSLDCDYTIFVPSTRFSNASCIKSPLTFFFLKLRAAEQVVRVISYQR